MGGTIMGNRLACLINVRDRPTELAMLLMSLRSQTSGPFDIFILDDQSGTPLEQYHFMACIITRMKLEGFEIYLKRTEFQHGVSKARQAIVDWARETKDYEFLARIDDDVILEHDYIERMFKVIEQGYDMASGVTPPMAAPTFERNPDFIKERVNRVLLDDEGNFIMNGDDCGMLYSQSRIMPADHFRSCALYKAKIHDKVNYLPTKLSMHGFREEQFLSFKMLMAGFTIGVDTGAIAWHQQTPSGGERFATQQQDIQFNQQQLVEFTKANKEELNKLYPHKNMPTELELKKENNLLM